MKQIKGKFLLAKYLETHEGEIKKKPQASRFYNSRCGKVETENYTWEELKKARKPVGTWMKNVKWR